MAYDAFDSITKAIKAHIVSRTKWAVAEFPGGTKGSMVCLMKGVSKDVFKTAIASIKRGKPVKSQTDATLAIQALLRHPSFYIGPYNLTNGLNRELAVVCQYEGTVAFELSNPNLFRYLDQLIEYIEAHDNVSQFSLSTKTAP